LHIDGCRFLLPFALAVLQRLGDVRGVDEVGAFEVGDGAADLQHAVIAARREVELAHRRVEDLLAARCELAEGCHVAGGHVRITGGLASSEAPVLNRTRRHHAGAHISRAFPVACARQLVVVDARNVDEDVYAVQQRPADALAVARDV